MSAIADPVLAQRTEDALRAEFPNAAIDLRPNYQGLIHAIIVSPSFNKMTEREKQKRVWEVLRSALGADSQNITLAIAYSTDELYS